MQDLFEEKLISLVDIVQQRTGTTNNDDTFNAFFSYEITNNYENLLKWLTTSLKVEKIHKMYLMRPCDCTHGYYLLSLVLFTRDHIKNLSTEGNY